MCVRLLLVSKTIGVTSLFKKDVPKKEMSKGDAVLSKKTVLGGGRRAKIALFLESCFRFSSFLIPLSHSLLYVCACCPWRFFPWKARGSFHTHTYIREYTAATPPTEIAFPAAGAHYSISELRNKNEMQVFFCPFFFFLWLQEGVLVLSFRCNGEPVARRFFLFPFPKDNQRTAPPICLLVLFSFLLMNTDGISSPCRVIIRWHKIRKKVLRLEER